MFGAICDMYMNNEYFIQDSLLTSMSTFESSRIFD